MYSSSLGTPGPVYTSWQQTIRSMRDLKVVYGASFPLFLLLNFVTAKLTFWFTEATSIPLWGVGFVVLLLGILWYVVYLLIAVARHQQHKPLPSITESVKPLPRFIAALLLVVVIVVAPFVLVSLTDGAAWSLMGPTPAEQDPMTMLLVLAALVWAFYMSARFSQTYILTTLRGLGPIAALRQAWSMSRSRFWYVFGWMIALMYFTAQPLIAANLVDVAILYRYPTFGALSLANAIIGSFLVIPWTTFYMLELFERLEPAQEESATR